MSGCCRAIRAAMGASLAVAVIALWQSARAEEPAATRRPAWTTSRIAGTPDPPPPYRVEPAFPSLTFDHPLDFAHEPGTDRLYVVEQAGKIQSFPNDPDCAQATLVADLTKVHSEITALYALEFHPDFANNRHVYVCYVTAGNQPDGSHIARFNLTRDEPPLLDPASEQVLLRWWSGGHNGCCLKFGQDGFLYISTGDGGAPAPPDPLQAGQDVSNLLSAVLRIDVDHTDGDQPYRVPPDNPFVELAGARPEIWAFGFRNPWRMSFDRVTGQLWLGDVGWQMWEMIYRVERGGNYGWAIMEGPQPVLPEAPRGPTPILPPVASHPHSEAASITGGYVYRGQRLPELEGAYIYGDYQTGKVWGLRHDGQQMTWQAELAQTPLQLASFGEDAAGELYLVDYDRTRQIYRLARNEDDGQHEKFPRRLSETGIFCSVVDQTPSPGVVSYEINAHQWADHATSRRWLAVPGNDPITIAENGQPVFPDGAVLAKTVSIEMQSGQPDSRRKLETQILHRAEESWRPYSYAWNEEQTDAELVPAAGLSVALRIEDAAAPGGMREQTYAIASRTECQACHNAWVETKQSLYGVQSASPLAVSVPQLNRPLADGGTTMNQLVALRNAGWLNGFLPDDPDATPRFADPYDASYDLAERARAYLHVNCGFCHQHHAGGTAMIDLAWDTPLADRKLIDVRPSQGAFAIANARLIAPADPLGSVLHYRIAKLGGGRMPRLGSTEVDAQGVAMIHDWIAQMPQAGSDPAPAAPPSDAADLAAAAHDEPSATRIEAIGRLTSSTRGALALLRLLEHGELPEEVRQTIITQTAAHPQAEVRDLFERFLPPDQRVKRLGTAIDAASLLALPADVERGRQFFLRDGATSCKSCHRVGDQGVALGPELNHIGKKYPPRDLLTHLLEPSKFIEPKFISYVLETTDGRVFTGLLVEKSESQVVLKDSRNQENRIAADEVEMLVPQQKSLMPELLLRDMTPQQAADLLAYLSSLK